MGNALKYNGNLNVLGQQIKKYRKLNNLSLENLSNKLQLIGITLLAGSLHKIEINQRVIRDYELAGLAKILNFSIEEILEDFNNQIDV